MTTAESERTRTGGFALFAECTVTGVWITVAAIPLVTALPAFAAGCAHLSRFLRGYGGGVRAFAADLRAAWRGSLPVTLAGWAALALLGVDVLIARSGLPGGPLVAAVVACAALALAVVGLRAAAAWSPGARWPALIRAAAVRARDDLFGSVLVAGGVIVVMTVTWQLPPLFVPAVGLLAGAALAVHGRGR